jgi:hypothetical protein
MATNDYKFLSHWRVKGNIDDVAAVISDPMDLPRWWPSVYRSITAETQSDGTVVYSLVTKAWLPYTLYWRFKSIPADPPRRILIEAVDDLEGSGEWLLEQDGEYVNLTYDWRVEARKPLLRALSGVFRPLFVANHRWAMARGEESLKRELLLRQRGGDDAGLPPVPPPISKAQSWSMLACVALSLAVPGSLLLKAAKPRDRR